LQNFRPTELMNANGFHVFLLLELSPSRISHANTNCYASALPGAQQVVVF
jgi:hypothetical protein